jgi:7-cyano-7-deazaguanine synthase
MSKVVHVFSGGLDSSVLLAELIREEVDEITCVNFFYGSKHNLRERRSARTICDLYGIKCLEISLDFMGELFDSALLAGEEEIPEGHYQAENMRRTVVPFRNGIMLSITAGLAESMDYDMISAGVHAGDHYIYPDCRPGFINSMWSALQYGTTNKVNLYTPYLIINKAEIIRRGVDANALFEHTYSCYKGRELHCGVCGACDERKASFIEAGLADLTEYEV